MSRYGEVHPSYARDRAPALEWVHGEEGLDSTREVTVPPGHCPQCSLDYELARRLTGRREESDHCSICEQEEGLA